MKTGSDNVASSPTTKADGSSPSKGSLTLIIRGLVPAFKNRKRAVIQNRLSKAGKPMAKSVTEPEVKERMQEIVSSIVSQLYSIYPTTGEGTSAECLKRCWTALLPPDDCWTVISDEGARGRKCEPGEERVEITIELLSPN